MLSANLYDAAFLSVAYGLVCATQAFYQAERFNRHIAINHAAHAVYYAIPCVILGVLYFSLSHLTGLAVAVYGIVFRMAFFDIMLNVIRGKSLLYNSTQDDVFDKKSSLIDWWENKIIRLRDAGGQRRLVILKISYIIICVAYVIIIF